MCVKENYKSEVLLICVFIALLWGAGNTRLLGLERESAKYGNATKKGRTSRKIHFNTKLPLGALNKLLKTQLVKFPPNFTRTHFDYVFII